MGCIRGHLQAGQRPIRADSGNQPDKYRKFGKPPIKFGKRPIKAMVLVGVLVGCFRACPPWSKTNPLKRPRLEVYKYRIWSHYLAMLKICRKMGVPSSWDTTSRDTSLNLSVFSPSPPTPRFPYHHGTTLQHRQRDDGCGFFNYRLCHMHTIRSTWMDVSSPH